VEPREVKFRYEDPVDLIWVGVAESCGLRLRRSSEVFASTDGVGGLVIGSSETLDSDDSLAQMIFHELVHWMIQGEAANAEPDWGLQNTDGTHDVRERACLRLQAILLAPYGLREFMAPTTDFRSFYDDLEADPMTGALGLERELLISGLSRSKGSPWQPVLDHALRATREIGLVLQGLSFLEGEKKNLWSLIRSGEEVEL